MASNSPVPAAVSDATPAYRGYRRQLLYALSRLLNPATSHLTFQPEGIEDLAVYDGETLVEFAQVKDHGADLTVSSLSTAGRGDSFFRRAATQLRAAPGAVPVLVSYVPDEQRFAVTGAPSLPPNRSTALRNVAGCALPHSP